MKFMIITLGCKVNTYESNVMRDSFIHENYIETDDIKSADIIIVNTCSVTNVADKKSLKTIRHARRENKEAILVVTGCSSQNKKETYEQMSDIDIVLGNINKSKIVGYIEQYLKTHQRIRDIRDIKKVPFENMALSHFNQTRAFIKIQDGCNNFCSYCIIPYVRGNVRSKKLEDVLEEANALVESGHKEIVLTGIHTGNYGKDLKIDLATLLYELVKIKGLARIRISSIEITEIDEKLLNIIKNNAILVDHMHIPLQSGSDTVLKRMNRKYDVASFEKIIKRLRDIRPNISITTDVIVGFPGETKEEFEETLRNIKKLVFSKLHVFPYSKREGTKASIMENQIDEVTKKERVKVLLKLSRQLEMEYAQKFIGKSLEFLPEVYKDGYLIGHTGNYLQIHAKGKKEDIGKIKRVVLKEIKDSYIIAQIEEKLFI